MNLNFFRWITLFGYNWVHVVLSYKHSSIFKSQKSDSGTLSSHTVLNLKIQSDFQLQKKSVDNCCVKKNIYLHFYQFEILINQQHMVLTACEQVAIVFECITSRLLHQN